MFAEEREFAGQTPDDQPQERRFVERSRAGIVTDQIRVGIGNWPKVPSSSKLQKTFWRMLLWQGFRVEAFKLLFDMRQHFHRIPARFDVIDCGNGDAQNARP